MTPDSSALSAGSYPTSSDPFWTETGESSSKEDLHRKRQWRIGPDLIALLRETAKKFEGTHNFHNFTVGRDFGDRSSQRHMKKIEVIIAI
jgi:tRNA pseudouridine38-40 synthase